MASMFDGTWYNQYPSQMTLKVDPTTGNVSGVYQTEVGAPNPGEKFSLVGFVSGDLLAFSVNFGKYGSLTSWAGQLTENKQGKEQIDTFWHLVKNVEDADEPKKMWAAVLTGADTFLRNPPETAAKALSHQLLPSHPVKQPK